MKTTRFIISALLFSGLMLAGTGCVSLDYSFNLDDTDESGSEEYYTDNETEASYVEFRMDAQGMSYGENGLLVDEEEYAGGKLEKGSELKYFMTDVEGFTESDGKYYPFINIAVIDSEENLLENQQDVGDLSTKGIEVVDADYIWSKIVLFDDVIESGETYTWYVVVNDSLNEDNSISSVIEFEVK